MGKGLGPLQKAILRIAYKKRNEDSLVSARDVLKEYYKFPVSHLPKSYNFFPREYIGVNRYMSKSVTVAQCFNRLMERGLIHRFYGEGIKLTRKGIKVVKSFQSS